MPFPRTTMNDVAQKMGVHTTTVSLALRNSPRLPLEPRQRIQALAKKMGYHHQDPMLTALMANRSNVATAKTQTTIAMIFDFESQKEFDQAPPSYRNFLTGATSKAEELGYKIQRIFFEGPHRLHPELEPAPPFLLPNAQQPEEVLPLLRKWIRRHRIQVVISDWTTVAAAFRADSAVVRLDPLLAVLNVNSKQGLYGGRAQQDTVVGERAVEQLAMLLKTNQTGCVDTPNRILVPGAWVDGSSPLALKSAG